MEYFLSALGLVFIIEGLPYFAFPEKMKTLVQKISEAPDSQLRGFGFLVALIGLLLIYISRRII